MSLLLEERFNQATIDPRLRWLNPPSRWRIDRQASSLCVEPYSPTDFWQRTHYGFQADNGHVLGLDIEGDFSLSTQVRFHPAHQYDQAGLMLYADANSWIKTSVEHELDGPPQLGVVVTHAGYSDWSMQDYSATHAKVCLRVSRRERDVSVFYSLTETVAWRALRILHWEIAPDRPVLAGLYACSPKGTGFRAEFHYLHLSASSP